MRHAIVTVLASLAFSGMAHAQSWQPPADSARCPSRWGATDERGAGNLKGPEAVLRAARLIRTGEVIELGQILSGAMPMPATRQFDVHTKRTFMNPESNRRGSNEEVVVAEIGHSGTQFDGFAHQTSATACTTASRSTTSPRVRASRSSEFRTPVRS